ncbi:MAG TPA: vWA domain-containing protein, partial [Phycisphaerae bacterium]|nr:vWA domain-containing protein [Phycisphaerae bacterium]
MNLVRFGDPWVLALLVPVWSLLLVAVLGQSRRRPGAVGRAVLACLASLLLVLALAGPSIRVSREGLCPVCIVEDVSGSMGSGEALAKALAPWAAALPRGSTQIVRFGNETETNIESGLAEGAAALPDGRGLVLLASDGRETRGEAVRAAERLAVRGRRVFAMAPEIPSRDVHLVSVAPISQPAPGEPVDIEVNVAATVAAEATVGLERLGNDGTPAARWRHRLDVDPLSVRTVRFEDVPPGAGIYRYRAVVTAADDEWPQNNTASCTVHIGRTRELFYVYAGKAPGRTFSILQARRSAGDAIRPVNAAEGLPLPTGNQTVLLLDNVSAWSLGDAAARRLAEYVTEAGVGLLVLGGDASFAAGGYGSSPLETLLPVSSRLGRRPALEMVLVMDASGSMNEQVGGSAVGETSPQSGGLTKLAVAKQAVLSLRTALAEEDRVGIVLFAGEPRTVSPLVPMTEWETLRRHLMGLSAGGGTRITPAVEAAVGLLGVPAADSRTVRHILLVSDGRSEDFDVPRLVGACRAAAVSVSAVATGEKADRPRLDRLAQETGGRSYATDVSARPRASQSSIGETFLKDLTWARGEGLREAPCAAAWREAEPIWRTAGPPLPPVEAYNVTRLKEGAEVHWAAEGKKADAVPLLATWRRGLGKVAAMPWPVDLASEAWMRDEALGRYLEDIVGWLSGGGEPIGWSAQLTEREGEWRVRAEMRPEEIGLASASFAVTIIGRD